MGKFKDWLNEEQTAGGGQTAIKTSAGLNANPTKVTRDNAQVTAGAISGNPKHLNTSQEIGAAAQRGNFTAVKEKMNKMGGEITNKFPKTTMRGVQTAISNLTPGVPDAKQLYADPNMKLSMMKKETHVIDTPKMAWKAQQASTTPDTMLPQKGTRISHNMGQRKRCSPVKPAKGTNLLGIKLPKTEKHTYKNPFA